MEYYESDFSLSPAVQYQPVHAVPKATPRKSGAAQLFLRQCAGAGALLVLLLGLKLFSPAALERAKEYLFSREIGAVELAMEGFMQNMLSGSEFGDAVVVFCQEVIDAQAAD